MCLFVLRLVPPTDRNFHRWTWGLMIFFALVTTSTFLTLCLQCIPLQGTWDRSITARCVSLEDVSIVGRLHGGKPKSKYDICRYSIAHYYCAEAFAILMDLLCVALPMIFLRKLSASPIDKIALFVIFGLGLLCVFQSLCRNLRFPSLLIAISPAATALARTILIHLRSPDPSCK